MQTASRALGGKGGLLCAAICVGRLQALEQQCSQDITRMAAFMGTPI